MKNLYILIAMLFISTATFAQTDGISYQAVILNPNSQELPGVDASGTILPNTAIIESIEIAEYIRSKVESYVYQLNDHTFSLTLSAGVAEVKEFDTQDSLNKRADTLLYQSKSNGRNKVSS